MKRINGGWILLILILSVLILTPAFADTLEVNEYQITSSSANETMPTLGNDGASDLVVYTVRPLVGGVPGPADIWYQRLNADGAPPSNVFPVQVTSAATDDQLNDVSGDYIVYTAFDDTGSSNGTIMLYQISTRVLQPLGSAMIIQEPRIHGNIVVWRVGLDVASQVMLYSLAWLGTSTDAMVLAGPVTTNFDVQIDYPFVVWAERNGGQYDIVAHDLRDSMTFAVTTTAEWDETVPATNGAWVVWCSQEHGELTSTIKAVNLETADFRVIANNGAGNYNPSINGDLITWESDVNENMDIFVYRISTEETFQVTTDPADQELNDVFGNLVAYEDSRGLDEDIYVSKLTFVPPTNNPPVADAGGDQTVHVGEMVTLDPTGSNDPDGDSLSYEWTLIEKPAGSTAELVVDDTIFRTLTPDFWGDYVVQLVVTDSLGAVSEPDTVTISTSNTAPVADAGPDQALTVLDIPVWLDGTGSWDDDVDPITYSWTIVALPAGSSASLDNPQSETPSFVPDLYGSYEFILVVSDPWDISEPDSVVVSFENVKPVADAGGNQSVLTGDTVVLDGTGSTDANEDELTYSWNFASKPAGSTAVLLNPTDPITNFVADLPGTYVISLVVNDDLLDSDPDNATVTATSKQDEIILILQNLITVINDLPSSDFRNKNLANALTNKINAVLRKIDQGLYQDALDKLENDILKKTDGCATQGSPDRNDWITDCAAQNQVYPLIMETIDLLNDLIGG